MALSQEDGARLLDRIQQLEVQMTNATLTQQSVAAGLPVYAYGIIGGVPLCFLLLSIIIFVKARNQSLKRRLARYNADGDDVELYTEISWLPDD